MTFVRRIASFIESECLLTHGARVVVGLSGGADSAALTAVLSELGYDIVAVHCHFGLRGEEADRDLAHSQMLAERFGAQFRSVRFNTREYMQQNGLSVEPACRELRYDFFETVRREVNAEAIAVGHHREDNVETLFLNLLRGSGIHGLRAMLPKRDNIVRPLLETSKAQILEYLAARNIPYITDSTNNENEYRRNRLRNVVLPVLEREFPGASERIADSLRCLRGNEALYNSLVPPFNGSLAGVTPTLLHEWLSPYGFNADQCAKILTSSSGATFVSSTHQLTVCPDNRVELSEIGNVHSARPKLSGHIVARPANFKPQAGVLYLDADAIPADAEWRLRPWQPGDKMKPFGMLGSKPVSDLLAAAGVAATKRGECYVLTLNGKILWAVGIRASALYPVTEKTENIIEIYNENV